MNYSERAMLLTIVASLALALWGIWHAPQMARGIVRFLLSLCSTTIILGWLWLLTPDQLLNAMGRDVSALAFLIAGVGFALLLSLVNPDY